MNTEDIYHNSPAESGDMDNSHYAEYVQLEQQEMESQPKAVTDVTMHIDCSKDSYIRTAQYMITQVKDGHIIATEAAAKISALSKALDAVKEGIREDVIREIEKHGKRALLYGTEMEVKEAGVKYDYSFCNDEVWKQLSAELEEAKERLKKREAFLKTITGHADLYDPETGLTWQAYPPRKTSTTTYQITHK